MNKNQFHFGRRFLFGFILLMIGFILILYHTQVISYDLKEFLISWKMLLVAIGIFVFANGNRGAGIIVMGIGAFAMIPDIFEDYDQIRKLFWPALLLLAGLAFMFGNRSKKAPRPPFRPDQNERFNSQDVNNDYFDEMVVFGGREINMATKNLLGGRSSAVFGGIEIDMRQCEISPEGCTIEVTTLFGGNTLKVPNDWTILNKITTIFGGYSDTRIKDASYQPNPAKTIILTGVCIFGGTEVRNYNKIH